jgi:hypothetical protein
VIGMMRSTRVRLMALAQGLRDGSIDSRQAAEEVERVVRREVGSVERYVAEAQRVLRAPRPGTFASHSARD